MTLGSAIISVCVDNRFGHPDEDVLARLAGPGSITVLRTER